jgi:hypothetical protein
MTSAGAKIFLLVAFINQLLMPRACLPTAKL